MYKVTDLSKRDIVNIADGSKLGAVTDLHFDLTDGKVMSLVVTPKKKMGIFSDSKEMVIPWDKIVKFGYDVVLVDLKKISAILTPCDAITYNCVRVKGFNFLRRKFF